MPYLVEGARTFLKVPKSLSSAARVEKPQIQAPFLPSRESATLVLGLGARGPGRGHEAEAGGPSIPRGPWAASTREMLTGSRISPLTAVWGWPSRGTRSQRNS